MDFTVERIKLLQDAPITEPNLFAEMAFLYDREVKANREEPIKHLALILNWDEETVGEIVSGAIEKGFLIKDLENKGQYLILIERNNMLNETENRILSVRYVLE